MKRTVLFVLGALLLQATSAHAIFIDRFVFQWRQKQAAAHTAAMRTLPFASGFWKFPATTEFASQGKYDQRLDHFDTGETRTFKQRYWVNSTYATDENSPVIYYICGESRCDAADGFALTIAKELHAYAVTLEHRYYGDSIPTATYSAADLKFLSSEQALADFAEFQQFATTEWKLKGRWISIGGSYPGALSAFYRLKYPNLVSGALASSAPVEARASFEEYDYQVATVVSATCLAKIQSAVSQIETQLANPSTNASVKTLFHSKEIVDDVDFLYVVADMAAIAIQYGSREPFCNALESATDLVPAYAKIGLQMFSMFGMEPIEDTPQGNLSEKPSDYTGNGMRQWLYQSCTEFGYYQVAYHDPAFSSRSPRVNLDWHNGMCDRLFGIKQQVDTATTNAKYYEPLLAGQANRIFFTNGSDDPWQNLSITTKRGNVPATVKATLISGAAHCGDLGNGSSQPIRDAQDEFRGMVNDWLQIATPAPAPETIPSPPSQKSSWPKSKTLGSL